MAQRISTVLFLLFCAVSPIAAQGDFQILYSKRVKDPTLSKGTLSVSNTGKFKGKKGIVILVSDMPKPLAKTFELSEVAQIHFADAKKTPADKLVLKNGKTFDGEIKSSFSIKNDGVTDYKRENLKTIIFIPAEKDKSCWTAPLAPDADPATTRYRSLYPFWDAPQVFRVRALAGQGYVGRKSSSKEADAEKEKSDLPRFATLKERADNEQLATCHKRFDDAASFPQVRFGEGGECIETPGAIIYEGMQLLIVEDGRYELAFNASTPRVPVTMRLTLCVDVTLKGEKKTIKLTIPAIALTPNYRSDDEDSGLYMARSNNYQENWHVRHVGYSETLARDLLAGGEITHYSRTGTARFGALPQAR